MTTSETSKILIVASSCFNGREMQATAKVLKRRQRPYVVVSSEYTIQNEVTGAWYKAADLWTNVKASDYAALIVISGRPDLTKKMWYDETLQQLVRSFDGLNKPIGAMCTAVPVIRSAAAGRLVSTYPLIEGETILKQAGARLTTCMIAADGNLITSEGRPRWGEVVDAVCDLLEGRKVAFSYTDTGMTSPLWEAKPMPEVQRLIEGRNNV